MLKPEQHDTFKLIAIDPGLNNLGVAIFHIRNNPLRILSIHAQTFRSEKLRDTLTYDEEVVTERFVKRMRLCEILKELIEEHQPTFFVSESPFFNRLKPGSFAVLTEVLVSIFDMVEHTDSRIRVSMKAPQSVKKTLGIAGKIGKDVVREAMKLQSATSLLIPPLDALDEHSIDAVGVGLCFFYEYFKEELNCETDN